MNPEPNFDPIASRLAETYPFDLDETLPIFELKPSISAPASAE